MRSIALVVVTFFVLPATVQAIDLFTDNFDVDPTANWTVNNNNLGTNAANFFFNYADAGIPPAPHSAGTTRGLKIGANLDPATAPGAGIPGISVSPTGQSFSGDYELAMDWWANYIGPLEVGALGSTMLSTYGIMSSGASANFPGTVDGVWFGATGDGQSSSDYRIYSPERPTSYDIFPASGNALDAHAIYAAGSRNQTAALYTTTFPAGATAPGSQASAPTQTGATPAGAAGFRWHDVRIRKVGATVTWSINNTLLGTLDTSFFSTGGSNILLGHSDTNSTTAASATLLDQFQFTLIDNVRVSSIVVPVNNADFNGDLEINAADYVLWREHNPTASGATKLMGDSDGDGDVDDTDYNNWKGTFGNTIPPGSGSALASAVVPEPTSLGLALLALLPIARRRSRLG